jgi:hypothetical protein
MMFERRKSNPRISSNNGTTNSHDEKNSAGATARSCTSDKKVRTACYCEENVWRLAYRKIMGALGVGQTNDVKENEEYYVVFVSNEGR